MWLPDSRCLYGSDRCTWVSVLLVKAQLRGEGLQHCWLSMPRWQDGDDKPGLLSCYTHSHVLTFILGIPLFITLHHDVQAPGSIRLRGFHFTGEGTEVQGRVQAPRGKWQGLAARSCLFIKPLAVQSAEGTRFYLLARLYRHWLISRGLIRFILHDLWKPLCSLFSSGGDVEWPGCIWPAACV